mmetsp:Transcript_32272/g.50042  ORF Transcript_32272/g.50042 Transcript_32272/m.50042 type:complete len:195 (+) Transcript_32272:80-664(+)
MSERSLRFINPSTGKKLPLLPLEVNNEQQSPKKRPGRLFSAPPKPNRTPPSQNLHRVLPFPTIEFFRHNHTSLHQELFDLDFHTVDCRPELRGFVGGNGTGNHGARYTTGAPKGNLTRNKDVRNILIFTQEWQVKKNFDGLGIGSHDDELGDSSIQGLGGFVSTLLGLLVVGGLLDQVQEGDGQVGVCERESLF